MSWVKRVICKLKCKLVCCGNGCVTESVQNTPEQKNKKL